MWRGTRKDTDIAELYPQHGLLWHKIYHDGISKKKGGRGGVSGAAWFWWPRPTTIVTKFVHRSGNYIMWPRTIPRDPFLFCGLMKLTLSTCTRSTSFPNRTLHKGTPKPNRILRWKNLQMLNSNECTVILNRLLSKWCIYTIIFWNYPR